MKNSLQKAIASLTLVVAFAITTGCTMIVSDSQLPRHKQRTVWISGVQYHQAYYVQNHNIVVVSQEMVQPKPKHWNRGKHKRH